MVINISVQLPAVGHQAKEYDAIWVGLAQTVDCQLMCPVLLQHELNTVFHNVPFKRALTNQVGTSDDDI